MTDADIAAVTPRGQGHQFAFYGDACSGVPGAPHEETFARVNRVVRRLRPPPEFIVFPGDEIIGLSQDEAVLRQQWKHWFDVEMAWLERDAIPLYNTTSNHTTYDAMSERVFTDVMAHLPRNGPADQQGLAYFVRCGDLLLVFVHTLSTALGGEGHVETDWLAETLAQHTDARWKFVVGHHPAFPVNGFAGPYQRTIGAEYVSRFWRLLVDHEVTAYLCSHILAFDVQCHDGVLQITSAGAGTAHRMPEGIEYLHCVQMAVDEDGLRYQVLDDTGARREKLSWPPRLPPVDHSMPGGVQATPWAGMPSDIVVLQLSGRTGTSSGPRQTLFAAMGEDTPPFWLGLIGRDQQLTAILQPTPGRSPHYWFGPTLSPDAPFDLQIMLHRDMGPGGLMWRAGDTHPWSSLDGVSAWGLERLTWPTHCCAGDGTFQGTDLRLACGWS